MKKTGDVKYIGLITTMLNLGLIHRIQAWQLRNDVFDRAMAYACQ